MLRPSSHYDFCLFLSNVILAFFLLDAAFISASGFVLARRGFAPVETQVSLEERHSNGIL